MFERPSVNQFFSVVRNYDINRFSKEHIPSSEISSRDGYLFAPRHLQKNQDFLYWHVNYDQGLSMAFDGEEEVQGIKTYRYTSSFTSDQTDHLTHLPGVPGERGINLDVSLSLWIEPMSGYLVKYEDDAIAYYYDQKTGSRIHPWNKFSNRYARSSIQNHVENAKAAKTSIIIIEFVLPLLLGTFLLGYFMYRGKEKKEALIVIIVGVVAATSLVAYPNLTVERQEPLVIGISKWVPSGNDAYDLKCSGV